MVQARWVKYPPVEQSFMHARTCIIAVDNRPPIDWKNWIELEHTAMSAALTAFWAAAREGGSINIGAKECKAL